MRLTEWYLSIRNAWDKIKLIHKIIDGFAITDIIKKKGQYFIEN